jgi:hypothetical protein
MVVAVGEENMVVVHITKAMLMKIPLPIPHAPLFFFSRTLSAIIVLWRQQ